MSILHQNGRKFFLEEVITLVYKKEKEKLRRGAENESLGVCGLEKGLKQNSKNIEKRREEGKEKLSCWEELEKRAGREPEKQQTV